MLVLFIIIGIVFFPYSQGYHVYLNPIFAQIFELSILINFIIPSIQKRSYYFLVFLVLLLIFYIKGLEYCVYTLRLLSVLIFTKLRAISKIQVVIGFILYTGFLIVRLLQGIDEPGLFMEFNLEGILWISMAIYISSNLLSRTVASIFLFFCCSLLILMDSKALFVSLFIYTVWKSRIVRYTSVPIILIVYFTVDFSIESIDRYHYWLAYWAYISESFYVAAFPALGVAVEGAAGEILKMKAPGNVLKWGYATSPAFHAYFLRALYDYGLLLGGYIIWRHFSAIRDIAGLSSTIALFLIGLSTNFIYGGLFLIAFIILKDAKIYRRTLSET